MGVKEVAQLVMATTTTRAQDDTGGGAAEYRHSASGGDSGGDGHDRDEGSHGVVVDADGDYCEGGSEDRAGDACGLGDEDCGGGYCYCYGRRDGRLSFFDVVWTKVLRVEDMRWERERVYSTEIEWR
ncbi:hypothetical protein M422DRAFT_257911 [Sphaerobolus stellatus SS14]|uniref:Uncharacterized protein n=1 Tax=Sphaerobolus stellatus (strain SS14) TaxID=990650 RepID=A0A0C9VMW3_SPHS4|nr:hypothetical protein M422DRAFT_257911 [Sphaerobolus stellatus SS14]